MRNLRNFYEFVNESYNTESLNEGKVFIVTMDDYDGKHNPEIARKYFSNQKKAEAWISDQGLEPAKHSKYITAPDGHIKSYSEPGGYGKSAELFQAVMETKLDEARAPKNWDSMFTMNAIKAYQNGEFDIDDPKSIEDWDTKYNGGQKPKPAFNTKELVDYAIKTGKKPDGSKLK